MRNNPERIAWTVLWLSFATFCILVTGIPLGVRSFLQNATDKQDTQMRVIDGTVLVQKANGGEPIGVTAAAEGSTLTQGDQVLTDAASWATLDLFDRSNVILYNNTQLTIPRTESPRFDVSNRPNRIRLNLTGGLMRVGVALADQRQTVFQVVTPHTTIDLDEGSYRIDVANDGTQITVVRGQATLTGDGGKVTLPEGTRTGVDLSAAPAEPQPAAQNLIVNGDFQEPLSTGWVSATVVLDPSVPPPGVEVVEADGRNAARFFRREGDTGNHTEISIHQSIAQDARDFSRLQVSMDVRLDFQSLSGGGLLSSEFPIIVRLDYKDRWGSDKFWTHGFYYQNRDNYPIALDPWGRPSGEQIPKDVWFPYESGNLLELLGDNRPAHITGLTVYASGWNYDSLVTEVQLVVE